MCSCVPLGNRRTSNGPLESLTDRGDEPHGSPALPWYLIRRYVLVRLYTIAGAVKSKKKIEISANSLGVELLGFRQTFRAK